MIELELLFSLKRANWYTLTLAILLTVYLDSKMTDIIELDLLLTESNHEGPRIELHIFFVHRCRQYIMVIQIFSFPFLRLSLPLATLRLGGQLTSYDTGT